MSSFQYWRDEIADMPAKQNGVWVDLETGQTYEDWLKCDDDKHIRERFVVDDKTKNARNVAKFFGGKALKGTAKQKKWAEQIRTTFLNSINSDCASILCTSDYFSHSKFWIENRNKKAQELEKFVKDAIEVIKLYNETNDKSEKEILQKKHKELLAAWGIEA